LVYIIRLKTKFRRHLVYTSIRGQLKCNGTRAETRFRLSAKRASPFKSAGASFQSTTDSRGVRISGSNAGYTMFRGSVKGTGYPLYLPVSPSLPLPASPCAITFQLESTKGQYVLSQKVNKLLNDNIHRPNVTSLRENKTTASMKNPQTQLNRNCLLNSGTHTTFHNKISYNFNILCIITFNFH